MIRRLAWLPAVAIAAVFVATSGHAQTPTPPPSGVATAVPAPTGTIEAPVAPSNVQIDLGLRRITWQDNSDNETGFAITYTVDTGVTATYTVGPNVTTFTIPADAPSFDCGHSLEVSVASIIHGSPSVPAVAAVASLCPPPSASTPTAEVENLPSTGVQGGSGGSVSGVPLAASVTFIGGLALMTGGAAVAARRRRRGITQR